MKLHEYIPLAIRTESVPLFTVAEDEGGGPYRAIAIAGRHRVRMTHSALGMASEIEELLEAQSNQDQVGVGEELADMMWYWAIAVDAQGPEEARSILAEVEASEPRPTTLSDGFSEALTICVSRWCDSVKKCAFYNRPIESNSAAMRLVAIACLIKWQMEWWNLDFEDQLRKNIDKLQTRYPEKFTNENANTRDLVAERKALES